MNNYQQLWYCLLSIFGKFAIIGVSLLAFWICFHVNDAERRQIYFCGSAIVFLRGVWSSQPNVRCWQNKDNQQREYHLRLCNSTLSALGSFLEAFCVSYYLCNKWLGYYLRFGKAVISMIGCLLQTCWSRWPLGGGNQWRWYYLNFVSSSLRGLVQRGAATYTSSMGKS